MRAALPHKRPGLGQRKHKEYESFYYADIHKAKEFIDKHNVTYVKGIDVVDIEHQWKHDDDDTQRELFHHTINGLIEKDEDGLVVIRNINLHMVTRKLAKVLVMTIFDQIRDAHN